MLVLGRDGRVRVERQPLPVPLTPPPAAEAARQVGSHLPAHASVLAALTRLYRRGAISSGAYAGYVASLRAALGTLKGLDGTPAREMSAVIGVLRRMAAERMLTARRLPALFLTLDRNRQWWTSGQVPPGGQIINFAGSQIDWEYYPGQGIQLQPLASFGKASWLLTHGPRGYRQGEALLGELVPLASRRAGGLTWEYYFNFDSGAPPWTSAMSQGTALQALADAYNVTGNRAYLLTARRVLTLFTVAPPRGVAVKTPRGLRFVQYTFDPSRRDEVINAFLQALIGLYTYAQAGGNQEALRLFDAGSAEAQHELPDFDTGTWSLYQPGVPDTISYHQLVTGFLERLCSLTRAPAYCATAARFESYARHPPAWVTR